MSPKNQGKKKSNAMHSNLGHTAPQGRLGHAPAADQLPPPFPYPSQFHQTHFYPAPEEQQYPPPNEPKFTRHLPAGGDSSQHYWVDSKSPQNEHPTSPLENFSSQMPADYFPDPDVQMLGLQPLAEPKEAALSSYQADDKPMLPGPSTDWPKEESSSPRSLSPAADERSTRDRPPRSPDYGGRERDPRRKAIEDKAAAKRKQATNRFAKELSNRIQGLPENGLANQLNMAAEQMKQDGKTIHQLTMDKRHLEKRVHDLEMQLKESNSRLAQ